MAASSVRDVLTRNRTFMMVIILSIASIVLVTTRVFADFATPFLETTGKVGAVSEERGYVVAMGGDVQDCTNYLVVVMNDNMQYIAINATADKKVVKESLLGRPVIIKAQVAAREEASNGMHVVLRLTILSVSPLKQ